jgi:hypothetical protein
VFSLPQNIFTTFQQQNTSSYSVKPKCNERYYRKDTLEGSERFGRDNYSPFALAGHI